MPDGDKSAQQSTVEYEVPLSMRRVHRRLQNWRSQRTGRERHGVNPVSRVLRLEFNHLKRVAEADGPKGRRRVPLEFVELISPQTSSGREIVLELEGPRGKLRIELKGTATAELVDISRALWEMLA